MILSLENIHELHRLVADAMEEPNQTIEIPPQSEKLDLSCVKYIDALWFCYSPFHQVKEYYREGTFDNCRSKWGSLFDCFNLKTLPDSKAQEILRSREKEKLDGHIWKFRNKDEASEAWKQRFGHLQDD